MTRTDPVAPCAGDAAIEEARKWAKIWRQRAIDCGWGNSTCNCGAPIAGNRGECDACFELQYPEHAKLAESDPTLPPDDEPMKVTIKGTDAEGNYVEETVELAGETPVTTTASFRSLGGPDAEERPLTREEACHHDTMCFGTCPGCRELRGEAPENDSGTITIPATAKLVEFVDDDALGSMDAAMDREIAKSEARKRQVAQTNMTLDEKLAIHLAEAIADGQEIAYCQGPKRHHVVVGTKFHDQLLERGCFHCGAFPEVV